MEDEDDDGFIVNDDELEDEDEVDEESYEDGDNDDEVPKRGKSSNGKMSSKKVLLGITLYYCMRFI